MRPAPAARFALGSQQPLRWITAGLLALAAGSAAAWGTTRMDLPGPAVLLVVIGAAFLSFAVMSYRRRPAATALRWDRRLWHLALPAQEDELAGNLSVVIDIGTWMLLKFEPITSAPAHWLAVGQRAGAPHWHALRCAVYSPRPAATPDASADEAAL